MEAVRDTLIELENRFWQSMVEGQTEVALAMLTEPAFLVNPQVAMKFDHAGYRHMADHASMVVIRYELGDMDVTLLGDSTAILSYDVTQVIAEKNQLGETEQRMRDTSTWVNIGGRWLCAMHTESPVARA